MTEKTKKHRILLVEDDRKLLFATSRVLKKAGYEVIEARTGEQGVELASKTRPDLVLLDVNLPDIGGFEVCARIKELPQKGKAHVVMLSAMRKSAEDRADGLESGADGYLTRPVSTRELLAWVNAMIRIKEAETRLQKAHDELETRVVERTEQLQSTVLRLEREIEERKKAENALENALSQISRFKERLEKENIYLKEEIKLEHNFDKIIGASDTLKYVLFKVEQVAPTDATVLILGETGTGKELIARAIHGQSHRKDRPLIKVDCTTLSPNLAESELFGHEKGAFTGADNRKIGRFELANKATVFLDEIGELPMRVQGKLLRVLQDGEFEPVGANQPVKVDVRVIAATNRDLERRIEQNLFRDDLFYRLNVFPITVPPLRKRKDDIPPLVNAFVKKYSKKIGKNITQIPSKYLEALKNYSWPGNVRELENIVERAVITSSEKTLQVELPGPGSPTGQEPETLDDLQRAHILKTLEECDWKIEGNSGAARLLNLKPSTLRSRMKKLGIRRSRYPY